MKLGNAIATYITPGHRLIIYYKYTHPKDSGNYIVSVHPINSSVYICVMYSPLVCELYVALPFYGYAAVCLILFDLLANAALQTMNISLSILVLTNSEKTSDKWS